MGRECFAFALQTEVATMKVTMIGTGYVGLVSGTCFADAGHDVICVDIDETKIARLRTGDIPIYEPGLSEIVVRNVENGRLQFTTSYEESVPGVDCVFIAVGTPQGEDGSASLTGLWKVVETLSRHLTPGTIVVTKSTVPVGTNRLIKERLNELCHFPVEVASNPEFLKEGAAIVDFTDPDRIVVGTTSQQTTDVLQKLYAPFTRDGQPFLSVGLESAEMIKYVANCLLATKISFINEMANICEVVGADINDVRQGIGHDFRIGFEFLAPGIGYGGSCFPNDVNALIRIAEDNHAPSQMLAAVDAVNRRQKEVLFNKLHAHFDGDLTGRFIAIWGLAFKPGTDDIREAPSLVLIEQLLNAGAIVQVHDPIAMDNVRSLFGDRIACFDDQYDVLENAEALAVVTEWSEFRDPDFDEMKRRLREAVVFDGRNLFRPERLRRAGFHYSGIGLAGQNARFAGPVHASSTNPVDKSSSAPTSA